MFRLEVFQSESAPRKPTFCTELKLSRPHLVMSRKSWALPGSDKQLTLVHISLNKEIVCLFNVCCSFFANCFVQGADSAGATHAT